MDEDDAYERTREELQKSWEKGEFFFKIDVSKYEIFPTIETKVKICGRCEIFYTGEKKCLKCCQKLQSLEDKVG